MTVENIAKVCHEANRAFCETIGDASQVPWEQAPNWQRTAAIANVRFHLDNPKAGSSQSHEEWCNEKLRSGWRWGPKKDPERKEHPCLVPFSELPLEQQLKDVLFVNVVHSLKPTIKK